MTTAISPAVTLDSHDAPAPCPICGGSFHVHRTDTDLEVCDDCQWHRVRSETPAMLTSSHDGPAVLAACVLCSGAMVVCDDIDICSACGSRRVRSHPKAAAKPDNREALAAYAHEAWSGWMRYLFSKCVRDGDPLVGHEGDIIIPAWAVGRWMRQMSTPYADLPESEKDSDRAEADKMLALMPAAASRDASLTAYVDDLLDLLQDVGGMSAEWCETELRKFETLLREG